MCGFRKEQGVVWESSGCGWVRGFGGFLAPAGDSGGYSCDENFEMPPDCRSVPVAARAGQLRKGGNPEDFARASPEDGAVSVCRHLDSYQTAPQGSLTCTRCSN